jgi:hypothetical protein
MCAQSSSENLVSISQQLLLAAKTGNETGLLMRQLQEAPFAQLQQQLETDESKKTFWLNIYNAYTQILLQKNPQAYKNRNRFFKAKQIAVAGYNFSLDLIEHGILRRSQNKLGLGYVAKWFPPAAEKKLRIGKKDYRIHFALNCGAKSCPPIAFYNTEKIDEQLKLAEKSFIKNDAEYDETAGSVSVSKIFSWFRGDFGGKKGIRKLLVKHGFAADGKKLKLRFKNYDWSLALKAYD